MSMKLMVLINEVTNSTFIWNSKVMHMVSSSTNNLREYVHTLSR